MMHENVTQVYGTLNLVGQIPKESRIAGHFGSRSFASERNTASFIGLNLHSTRTL